MPDVQFLTQLGTEYLEVRDFFNKFVDGVITSGNFIPSFALIARESYHMDFSFCDIAFRFRIATSINAEAMGAFRVVSETKRDQDQGIVYIANQSIDITSTSAGAPSQV